MLQPDSVPTAAHDRPKLGDTIYNIGEYLADLDPGPLATLRRMSLDGDGIGAPCFWRLAARHEFGNQTLAWAHIVQIMAILTVKGRDQNKRSPHAPKSKATGWRGLGRALCDGGDLAWGQGNPDPRPMLSEQRFARLLAARGEVRTTLLSQAARALAAKKPGGAGVDCTDIARLLLFPDAPEPARDLARDYYARLDRATQRDGNGSTSNPTGDIE